MNIEALISQMSPEQLGVYEQRLTKAMRLLSPQQRITVLARIKDIPELGNVARNLATQYSQSQQGDTPRIQGYINPYHRLIGGLGSFKWHWEQLSRSALCRRIFRN